MLKTTKLQILITSIVQLFARFSMNKVVVST